MAGKTNYKMMPLAELEELERNLAAQSKRPSVALKAALRVARADALHEAAAAAATAPEPEQTPEEIALARAERAAGFGPDEEAANEQAAADLVDEVIEDAAEPDAPTAATRKLFDVRVAQLVKDGFTQSQAIEALAIDFPAEAAEYQPEPQPIEQPPTRDERDIDQSTGELKVDRTDPVQAATPYARVGVDARPVVYYWGKVTICVPVDGGEETTQVVTCECQWGHMTPEIALKCARKVASSHGVRIA
jgi:hypothetical protein